MDDYERLPGFITGTSGPSLEDQQRDRERAAREAALGKRAKSILDGDFGPVLKRWVSGTVVPVTARLREVADASLTGDGATVARLLQSPVFGLPDVGSDSRDLRAVLTWFSKPGIGDDLVLAVLATAILRCARSEKPAKLTALLGQCAQAARETAMGQFLTQVQGAKAMLKVRGKDKRAWAQASKLDAIAALLGGQVRSGLENMEVPLKGKSVVHVITPKGETRRIDLKAPSAGDWRLLEVARHVKGEADTNGGTWMSFAMLVLCAAQAEAGWFDLVQVDAEVTASKRRHRTRSHGLVLSDSAHDAIKKDIDRWVGMGFVAEPMLVKPVMGDYLTVKHREVAGGRGPMGLKTNAHKSAAWRAASDAMANTAWTVATGTLEFLDTDLGKELLLRDYGVKLHGPGVVDDRSGMAPKAQLTIAAYRRLATKQFYLPIYMDFRGRVYYRPTLVTLQGSDLQKGLLCFPDNGESGPPTATEIVAIALHASAQYGGPNKLDKASEGVRLAWFVDLCERWKLGATKELLEADEPFTLYTCMDLYTKGQWDRIPLQIDGTCNGLQHLSALFRDETAAPFVNLARGGDTPADIYAEVARRVAGRLLRAGTPGDDQPDGHDQEPWRQRLLAAIKVDRKLMKKPVMVLPYGGTRGTIDDAVLDGILGQNPAAKYWLAGYAMVGHDTVWPDWREGHYAAYCERDLKDHPLLHLDAQRLGGLVWDVINEVLPKPMATMKTFRDIAKFVGARTLEWDTGVEDKWGDSLWVTQAKAKSARSTLRFKSLHLPGSVRGLQVRLGRDEVDASAHTSGIVANFIHSQDAAHLARTMMQFLRMGGSSFGAIHDCYVTRPSQMYNLAESVRWAFCRQYQRDPLAQPVMLYEPGSKVGTAYGSWYELAVAAGSAFPEDGSWDPQEVMFSKWCFS